MCLGFGAQSDLSDARLVQASQVQASLVHAGLKGADLKGADFRQADLEKTKTELSAETTWIVERSRSSVILWVAGMLLSQGALVATLGKLF